jgi:hypothetical protein
MVTLAFVLLLVGCLVLAEVDEGGCLGGLASFIGVLLLVALAVRFVKWVWFLEG